MTMVAHYQRSLSAVALDICQSALKHSIGVFFSATFFTFVFNKNARREQVAAGVGGKKI